MPDGVGVGRNSYAVVFCEQGAVGVAGSLALTPDRLWLDGSAHGRPRRLSLSFADLAEVRVGRSPEDRIDGHPTLVLERAGMPAVLVAPVGAGLLHEVADLLSALGHEQDARDEQLSVVVPLEPGSREQAARLLQYGPPFDPASLGLRRHYIYLDEAEAVFVFEGPEIQEKMKRAMRRPEVWRAGLAWRKLIAQAPRAESGFAQPRETAHLAYNWASEAEPSS